MACYEQYGGGYGSGGMVSQGQSVRVYCKANPDYALGIRDGKVRMVSFDPMDPSQQWEKVEKWCSQVKDSVGHSAFCLVNKATGQALRHANAAGQEVLLTRFDPDCYDEDIMWSESEDMGYGYHTLRSANDISKNMDVFQGDLAHGGVKECNPVVFWKWTKGDNQLWKVSPLNTHGSY